MSGSSGQLETFWPGKGADTASYPGRVRRSITVDSWFEDGQLVFEAELHDRWLPDDADAGEIEAGREDIHRYQVQVRADGAELTIRDIQARPMVLPFGECPNAVLSAQRLVGRPLTRGFLPVLKEELGSVRGCTHLHTLMQAIWASQVVTSYLVSRPMRLAGVGRPLHMIRRVFNACVGWAEGGRAVAQAREGRPNLERWHEGLPIAPLPEAARREETS